jgi:EmrB/QacA subfamily drug resistance transporter
MASTTSDTRLSPELLKLAGVIMLGALMMQLDITMTTIATNTLLREFHTTLSTIQWVGTGYLLAMATTIPLAGWALERYGARTTWMLTLAIFLLGSLGSSAAWSVGSLIAFRVVQGVGAGMILPLAQAILAMAAGPERLGRVMATIGIPALLGPVLGPVLGGLIVSDLSWRWIFLANIPICLAALALSPRFLPDTRAPGASSLDWLGLALLSPAFAAMIYGFAEAGHRGSFGSPAVLGPVIAGLALLAGFVLHALRRTGHALIDLRLFRGRAFAASAGTMLLSSGILFGALGLLPLYYQQVRGEDALHTGLLLIPFGVGMGASLSIAGRLADRVAVRRIALVGLALSAAGSLAYTQLDAGTGYWGLGVAQLASGAGVGGLLVPVMTAALRGLAPDAIPRASVAVRMFQQLGGSIGSAILFVVLQREIVAGGPGDLGPAFGQTFWWVVGFAALTLVPTLLLPGPPVREAPSRP